MRRMLSWFSNLSLKGVLAILFLLLLFADMAGYYIVGAMGREVPAFSISAQIVPILQELPKLFSAKPLEELEEDAER